MKRGRFTESQSEAMDECPSDHVDSVHALFRSLFLRPQENESKGDYAFVYLYTDGDDMVKEPFVGYGEFEVGLSSKLQDSCEKRAHETAIN
jgi:hypothetical protein